eukprot:XP_019072434.1 PREDICTED: histidine-containing phosphotransfer protein 1 isoform X6 [Vitis vinifera]
MSVDGGIFFSEIFPATKQSVNRKCYSMIFSIADKTELNMDIARRQARINQLVREMLVEGLLNDHFHLVQAIRVAGDFQFVAKIILLYCTQIRTNIRAIANYLTEPNIDYAGAAVCAGHLGICSCSIGAQSIQHACRLFMQACAHRSRDQCVGVFYMLRGECSRLLPKFLEVLQLEMQILYLRRQI